MVKGGEGYKGRQQVKELHHKNGRTTRQKLKTSESAWDSSEFHSSRLFPQIHYHLNQIIFWIYLRISVPHTVHRPEAKTHRESSDRFFVSTGKKSKYLGISFMNDERKERVRGPQIRVSYSIMRTLLWSVGVKDLLKDKASNLLVHLQSNPHLWPWLFLCGVTGLNEPQLFLIKMSQLRGFRHLDRISIWRFSRCILQGDDLKEVEIVYTLSGLTP